MTVAPILRGFGLAIMPMPREWRWGRADIINGNVVVTWWRFGPLAAFVSKWA